MKSTHSALQKLKMYSIIDFAVLLEAVLESAPRFTIQLYAISVQEEPAAIIQIVSLPISFLTLAWAFTATDKWSLPVCKIMPSSGDLNVKLQIALYVTHVLLLSIRLFAICYFTVSYKWWVIGVVMFHSCVVVMAKFFQDWDVFFTIVFMGIYCLRDDFVDFSNAVNVFGLTKIMFLSHILFVLEHFFMILMFYFTYHPNAWYTLAVTVSVCVLSVLGSTMRMYLLLWLKKKTASSSIASSRGDVNTC